MSYIKPEFQLFKILLFSLTFHIPPFVYPHMKKYILLLFVAFTAQAKAQWINSLSIYPPNPSITDSVYLIANCSFPSGACDDHTQAVSVNGNSITAWALHCVGMATFICNHADTLNMGLLAPGTYTASFQLDHGMGPGPCTPGIVPGPNSSITFNVSLVTSLPNPLQDAHSLVIYPNPASGQLFFDHVKANSDKCLLDVTGQCVLRTQGSSMDISTIPKGIYMVRCEGQYRKVLID